MRKLRTVVQTPAAQEDILGIHQTIAIDRPIAADRLLARIGAAIERIRDFPASAADGSKLAPGLRIVSVSPYLVFYRFDADEVLIVRVVHGARDLGDIDLDDSYRR